MNDDIYVGSVSKTSSSHRRQYFQVAVMHTFVECLNAGWGDCFFFTFIQFEGKYIFLCPPPLLSQCLPGSDEMPCLFRCLLHLLHGSKSVCWMNTKQGDLNIIDYQTVPEYSKACYVDTLTNTAIVTLIFSSSKLFSFIQGIFFYKCVCMWRSKADIRHLPWSLSILYIEAGPLTWTQDSPFSLSVRSLAPWISYLCFPSLRITAWPLHPPTQHLCQH